MTLPAHFDGYNYDPRWFGAACDQSTDDYAAIMDTIDAMPDGATLRFPLGLCAIGANQTIEIDRDISIVGASKKRSGLIGLGFSQDVPLIRYTGSTASRIQDIRVSDIMLRSDNGQAKGIQADWVNTSDFDRLYFYNLYRGMSAEYGWSNRFNGMRAYSITKDTVLFGTECNQATFIGCAFTGENGFRVIGNTGDLAFINCDFENITSSNGAGIYLAPASGKKIDGVSIIGGYWEKIKGYAIACFGADARSVRGLGIIGTYLYGGHANKFGSASGSAQHAIVLNNVDGFVAEANVVVDWQTCAFYNNATARNGRISRPILDATPNLVNPPTTFHSSVVVTASV